MVFSGSIGRTDFPGGKSSRLKQSIADIADLPQKLLLPGHNEVIEGHEAIERNYAFIKKSFFPYL